MKFSTAVWSLSLTIGLVRATPTDNPQQYPLVHRQTIRQAADHVGFLLRNMTMGSIASVYPPTSDRAEHPFVANESTHNILADPEGRTSYLVQEQQLPLDRDGRGTGHGGKSGKEGGRSRMDYARVTLIGRMHPIDYPHPSNSTSPPDQLDAMQQCYTSYHPDARRWLPNTPGAHSSFWARLTVEDVYYVGGFGDLHYIGHIPLDMIHLDVDR